jgi:sodium ion-translocating decarboxylase beta subunit
LREAASIGIIGGADGPTTIFVSANLAPDILGITALTGYSYMPSVAIIQPPIMKLLTSKKERAIEMRPLREVSKEEKLIFAVAVTIVTLLIVSDAAPLIAMFMLGNLFKESGMVPRLFNSASNEILNIATIFLMITIGSQLNPDVFFRGKTLAILGMGLGAFAFGTAGGLIFAKLMNLFLKEKINPLLGSAGVSAVPISARLAHKLAQEANPKAFILPHAMGPTSRASSVPHCAPAYSSPCWSD